MADENVAGFTRESRCTNRDAPPHPESLRAELALVREASVPISRDRQVAERGAVFAPPSVAGTWRAPRRLWLLHYTASDPCLQIRNMNWPTRAGPASRAETWLWSARAVVAMTPNGRGTQYRKSKGRKPPRSKPPLLRSTQVASSEIVLSCPGAPKVSS